MRCFERLATAALLVDLRGSTWKPLLPAVVSIAVSSTFPGPFVVVAVGGVFQAQTLANSLRFPMTFRCGPHVASERPPALLPSRAAAAPASPAVPPRSRYGTCEHWDREAT